MELEVGGIYENKERTFRTKIEGIYISSSASRAVVLGCVRQDINREDGDVFKSSIVNDVGDAFHRKVDSLSFDEEATARHEMYLKVLKEMDNADKLKIHRERLVSTLTDLMYSWEVNRSMFLGSSWNSMVAVLDDLFDIISSKKGLEENGDE